MKNFLCLFLAFIICFAVTACSASNGKETTADTKTTESTTKPDVPPEPSDKPGENKMITQKAGRYASIVYNPAYCSVSAEIRKGVGSKEEITLRIKMFGGYSFDGWSQISVLPNENATVYVSDAAGKRAAKKLAELVGGTLLLSNEAEYTFTASKDITVYANYSVSVIYNANGGTAKDGGELYTQKYSVVMYKCPNTLPDKGYFVRDGYTLVEYNTKADGSGTAVGLGSRIATDGESSMELYCIWKKQSPSSDFEYTSGDSGISISKYTGKDKNIVIPEIIDGKNVYKIEKSAFAGSDIEYVVIPKTVTKAEDGAFSDCSSLETLVIFDTLTNVSDESFENCGKLKNLRINAALDHYASVTDGNNKIDRVIWAKTTGKKLIVIVGGSGSINGFDSAAISEKYGDEYVIINLGTNANISATIYFEYLSSVLDKDDIILWAPEAGEYVLGYTAMHIRAWEFQSGHYDIFRSVDISKYTKVFSSFASYARAHKSSEEPFDAFMLSSSDYKIPYYNEYGDAIEPRAHQEKSYKGEYSYSFEKCGSGFEKGAYDYMASVIEGMTLRDIKVWLVYAAMDKEAEKSFDDFMDKFTAAVKEKYKGTEVISDYHNILMEDKYMSDSAWHLTLEGAAKRTKTVISDLNKKLGK